MKIRRAQEKDIPAINRLLLQVELVHHKGGPDLFRNGGRKYTQKVECMCVCYLLQLA